MDPRQRDKAGTGRAAPRETPDSGAEPQVLSTTVTMSASVTQATAILTGFLVEHSEEMIMILATRHSGQTSQVVASMEPTWRLKR